MLVDGSQMFKSFGVMVYVYIWTSGKKNLHPHGHRPLTHILKGYICNPSFSPHRGNIRENNYSISDMSSFTSWVIDSMYKTEKTANWPRNKFVKTVTNYPKRWSFFHLQELSFFFRCDSISRFCSVRPSFIIVDWGVLSRGRKSINLWNKSVKSANVRSHL